MNSLLQLRVQFFCIDSVRPHRFFYMHKNAKLLQTAAAGDWPTENIKKFSIVHIFGSELTHDSSCPSVCWSVLAGWLGSMSKLPKKAGKFLQDPIEGA